MAKVTGKVNTLAQKVARYAMWSFFSMLFLIIVSSTILFTITFNKYENKKEGWSLLYPRAWNVRKDVPAGGIVAFVAKKANPLDVFQDNIAITYTDLSKQPLTLSEYVDTAKMQMTKTLKDITVAESRLMNIAGHPGAKLFFQATGELKLTLVVYVFIFNNVAYNITYAAMTEHYEKTGRFLVEIIMATLKVVF